MNDEDFEAAVRVDAPYFRRLNPILMSMGFLVAADTISPEHAHEFQHILKNAIHSDCHFCMEAVTRSNEAKL